MLNMSTKEADSELPSGLSLARRVQFLLSSVHSLREAFNPGRNPGQTEDEGSGEQPFSSNISCRKSASDALLRVSQSSL